MGQPKGYEPYTLYWETVFHWSSPMVTARGQYLTKARWAWRRFYNDADVEEAVRQAANPQPLIQQQTIWGPFEDVIVNGPLPIVWLNRRDFVEPMMKIYSSKAVILATGL